MQGGGAEWVGEPWRSCGPQLWLWSSSLLVDTGARREREAFSMEGSELVPSLLKASEPPLNYPVPAETRGFSTPFHLPAMDTQAAEVTNGPHVCPHARTHARTRYTGGASPRALPPSHLDPPRQVSC